MQDVFKIGRPALIAFSGGRTSGYMLMRIIRAYGGRLPKDIIPCFQNTGLEHPATYEFVDKISRTITPITWLEYRAGPSFEVVTAKTASKKGEPFEALIRHTRYLPNPAARKCTGELKIRTARRFAKSLGWKEYVNAVGLRADEPLRVSKMQDDSANENVVMPLAETGCTERDSIVFWKGMPFDLQIPSNDFGNCNLCFLKSTRATYNVMRADPSVAEFWIRMESLNLADSPNGAVFRNNRPAYRDMLEISKLLTAAAAVPDDEGLRLPCHCTD